VLGHGAAGKTSLLNAMQQIVTGKKVKNLSQTESTIGFDASELKISSNIKFAIFDFAGQLEYITTHK
jgi:GTPase SAR1 family protein